MQTCIKSSLEDRDFAELRLCAADMVCFMLALHNSGHDSREPEQIISKWCALTGNTLRATGGKLEIIRVLD